MDDAGPGLSRSRCRRRRPRAQSAGDVLRVRCEPVTVVAGSSVEVEVVLEIVSGWHVNANPPSPEYLIPVTRERDGRARAWRRGACSTRPGGR